MKASTRGTPKRTARERALIARAWAAYDAAYDIAYARAQGRLSPHDLGVAAGYDAYGAVVRAASGADTPEAS